jgi:hypothetical protein
MTESQNWLSDIPISGTQDDSTPSASWLVDAATITDMTRPPAHFSGDGEAPMRYWDNEASEAWSTEETIVLAQANQPLVTSPNGVEEVSVRVSEADIFVGKGDKLLQTKDYENAIEQYKKGM